jgi:hypothetical protein
VIFNTALKRQLLFWRLHAMDNSARIFIDFQ